MSRYRGTEKSELVQLDWDHVNSVARKIGWTMSDVSEMIGCARGSLNATKAHNNAITLFRAEKIADVLGTSVDELKGINGIDTESVPSPAIVIEQPIPSPATHEEPEIHSTGTKALLRRILAAYEASGETMIPVKVVQEIIK